MATIGLISSGEAANTRQQLEAIPPRPASVAYVHGA
jgi:hypothetical protein